jgi:hypothetical protein
VGFRYPRGAVDPARDGPAPPAPDPDPAAVLPDGPEPPGRAASGRGSSRTKPHDAWLWRAVSLARARGWKVAYWYDSRRSPPGFPDLFAVHAEQRRRIHIELKTGAADLSRHQREWRDTLVASESEWYCLRPDDEAILVRILEGL